MGSPRIHGELRMLGYGLNAYTAKAQNKKNNCDHPPKMLSQPRFSVEDRTKWKGKTVSGRVALVVSENGDVAEARVLTASPEEAAESLLDAVKRAKFSPPLGCGELKTEVVLTLTR
jgi:TonB family protein